MVLLKKCLIGINRLLDAPHVAHRSVRPVVLLNLRSSRLRVSGPARERGDFFFSGALDNLFELRSHTSCPVHALVVAGSAQQTARTVRFTSVICASSPPYTNESSGGSQGCVFPARFVSANSSLVSLDVSETSLLSAGGTVVPTRSRHSSWCQHRPHCSRLFPHPVLIVTLGNLRAALCLLNLSAVPSWNRFQALLSLFAPRSCSHLDAVLAFR